MSNMSSSPSGSYSSDISISIIGESEDNGGDKESIGGIPPVSVTQSPPPTSAAASFSDLNSFTSYYVLTEGGYDSKIVRNLRKLCSVGTDFFSEYLEGTYAVTNPVDGHGDCLFLTFAKLCEELDERAAANVFRHVAVSHVVENIKRGTSFGIEYQTQLEEPVDEYKARMMRPSEWGGALEMLAISRELNVEVKCFSVINNREILFNSAAEGNQCDGLAPASTFLVSFTGVHYDPIIVSDGCNSMKRFEPQDSYAVELAHKFIESERRAGKYVDTSNPDWKLVCLTCGKELGCKKEAADHMQLSGHDTFGPMTGM